MIGLVVPPGQLELPNMNTKKLVSTACCGPLPDAKPVHTYHSKVLLPFLIETYAAHFP